MDFGGRKSHLVEWFFIWECVKLWIYLLLMFAWHLSLKCACWSAPPALPSVGDRQRSHSYCQGFRRRSPVKLAFTRLDLPPFFPNKKEILNIVKKCWKNMKVTSVFLPSTSKSEVFEYWSFSGLCFLCQLPIVLDSSFPSCTVDLQGPQGLGLFRSIAIARFCASSSLIMSHAFLICLWLIASDCVGAVGFQRSLCLFHSLSAVAFLKVNSACLREIAAFRSVPAGRLG